MRKSRFREEQITYTLRHSGPQLQTSGLDLILKQAS